MENTELESLEEQAIKNEIKFSQKIIEIATDFLDGAFTAEEAMKRIAHEAAMYSLERLTYMCAYKRMSQKED